MQSAELVLNILRRVLEEQGPQLGARLKQVLSSELVACGEPRFDQRHFGYRGFADFLMAQGGAFAVERPNGPGDIRVSLSAGAAPARSSEPSAARATLSARGEPGPVGTLRFMRRAADSDALHGGLGTDGRVRNDVWQAFTNPDPARKRFLHRTSGQVRHFRLDEADPPARRAVEQSPKDWAEIEPVQGDAQLRWMREYLDDLPVSPPERAALGRLTEGTYTSQLNTVFLSALGEAAVGWRRRRTGHVWAHIEAWAKVQEIPMRLVFEPRAMAEHTTLPDAPTTLPRPVAETVMEGSSRSRVMALLAMLSDREVEDTVLPLLLATIWTSGRRRE